MVLILTCPNCGGPLNTIDDDSCICVHCKTRYGIAKNDSDVRLIEVSEDASFELVRICQEFVRSKEYSMIGKYADMILKNDPEDYRGMYYKGIYIYSTKDYGFDDIWAAAVDLCDGHWLDKIHSEIPRIAVDAAIEIFRNEKGATTVIPLFLQKTFAAFDRTDRSHSGISIYSKMLVYIKELSLEYYDPKIFYAMVDIIRKIFDHICIARIADYDYLRFMFSMTAEIMNIFIDKLPLYDNIYDVNRIPYHSWTRSEAIVYIKIEDAFKERLEHMDEGSIRRLREYYEHSAPKNPFKLFFKIKDDKFKTAPVFGDKKNRRAVTKVNKDIRRFVDSYLMI